MSSNCISIIEKVYEMFRQSSIAYGHGTDNAWDEAVYLVTSVADLADDESSASLKISDRLIDQILGFAERRINERLPLAYLLGFCEYAGCVSEADTSKEDIKKVQEVTKIMAEKLNGVSQ